MAVSYKDIDLLSQKSPVAGTEKLPVSDTQYITPNQIASLASSGVVHTTGDETIGGDKTFTDDIVVGDASNIVYSGGGGGGFTKGTKSTTNGSAANTIVFSGLPGEPKAFVATINYFSLPGTSTAATLTVVGDSTVCHGVYTSGTQHNYSASFTKSYTSGTLTITAPTGVVFLGTYGLTFYYGDGTLTFRTSQVSPGSGVTSVTFTGTGLTEVPTMYACMLETQVSSASYRRVASYTNSFYDAMDAEDVVSEGLTFYSNQIANTTSSFSVSYNNGLFINSGGTSAGGYFHNPGTYTLYYLMASDIGGGGGGSYQSLSAELSAITTSISGKEASSNKVTSLSNASTDTQYPSAKCVYDIVGDIETLLTALL